MKPIQLSQIRGLKYPDEYVIKFFFRENLHLRQSKVLELGCGNGNNLMLFREYGWDIAGMDVDPQGIQDAAHNFGRFGSAGQFFTERNISKGVKEFLPPGPYYVALFANVLYYLTKAHARQAFLEAASLMEDEGWVFLRNRTLRDYRYGRGRRTGENEFFLDTAETQEQGQINVFYHEYELIDLLRSAFAVDSASLRILYIDYQTADHLSPLDRSPANRTEVSNSDVVIWAKVRKLQ